MRSIIIIWSVVIVTLIGVTNYINTSLDVWALQSLKEQNTRVPTEQLQPAINPQTTTDGKEIQ